jgi:hypothetical protein
MLGAIGDSLALDPQGRVSPSRTQLSQESAGGYVLDDGVSGSYISVSDLEARCGKLPDIHHYR